MNPEMSYTAMRDSQHPDAGVTVFATSRRSDIQGILDSMGLNEVVAEFSGMLPIHDTLFHF